MQPDLPFGPSWDDVIDGTASARSALGLKSHADARIKRIVKRDDKWCVLAEDSDRSFGCYDTRHEAHVRLGQIEAFARGDKVSLRPRVKYSEDQPRDHGRFAESEGGGATAGVDKGVAALGRSGAMDVLESAFGNRYNSPLAGGCLVVAQALQQVYGGKLAAIVTASPTHVAYAEETGKSPIVDHFVVDIGEGKYLDANGVQTRDELLGGEHSMDRPWAGQLSDGTYLNRVIPASEKLVADASQYIQSPPGAADQMAAYIRSADEKSRRGRTRVKYSEDEPRDERGRWTDGGTSDSVGEHMADAHGYDLPTIQHIVGIVQGAHPGDEAAAYTRMDEMHTAEHVGVGGIVNPAQGRVSDTQLEEVRQNVLDSFSNEGSGGATLNMATGEHVFAGPPEEGGNAQGVYNIAMNIPTGERGTEGRPDESVLQDPKAFNDAVRAEIDRFASAFNAPGANLGLWNDQGKLYVDAVYLASSEKEATERAIQYGQTGYMLMGTATSGLVDINLAGDELRRALDNREAVQAGTYDPFFKSREGARVKYSPDQPRDDLGRFGEGDGGGDAANTSQSSPITPREDAAIDAYVNDDNATVNYSLRNGSAAWDELGEGTVQDVVDGIDSALAKSTLDGDTTLYRGEGMHENLSAGATTPADAGYLSTSTSPTTGQGFGGDQYVISAPAGTHALNLGGEEYEVLLPRDTVLRIDTAVTQPDGSTHYTAHIEPKGMKARATGKRRSATHRIKYSEDQPRDERGRFGEGGGAATPPEDARIRDGFHPTSRTFAGLRELATHYSTFEEFSHAYSVDGLHGRYWHLTDDPNFQVDPNWHPSDVPAGQQEGYHDDSYAGGLMVTTDPTQWPADALGERAYAVQVDLHGEPGRDYVDPKRGYNELYVSNLSTVTTGSVISRDSATSAASRYFQTIPQTPEELKLVWDEAHTTGKRRAGARVKHGDHDQSDHGNWAHGGGGGTDTVVTSENYRDSWRPEMSPEEGHAWAKAAGSKYTETVVHMTQLDAVDGIRGTGFHTDAESLYGPAHEAGAYFASDPEVAAFYTYKGDAAVSAAVVLQNPVYVDFPTELGDAGNSNEDFRLAAIQAAGLDDEPIGGHFRDGSEMTTSWDAQATTDALKGAGYDGVVITVDLDSGTGESVGGNQVIVFDKEQAVVIGTTELPNYINQDFTVPSDKPAIESAFAKAIAGGRLRIVHVKEWDESLHPRDDLGRFGEGGGDTSTEQESITGFNLIEPGISKDHPYVTTDVKDAIRALGAGKYVDLHQANGKSTLLSELRSVVMAAGGRDYPKTSDQFDLCRISIEGTNLFCGESLGIARVDMPQLSGRPEPGSIADRDEERFPKNEKGEVDLSSAFAEHLAVLGQSVTERTVEASWLRASQSQLDGVKVTTIAVAIEEGNFHRTSPIYVTTDNYIIDGHHGWAGTVAQELISGNDQPDVPVVQVNMNITDALREAVAWTHAMGVGGQGMTAKTFATHRIKYGNWEKALSKGFGDPGSTQEQDRDGRFTAGTGITHPVEINDLSGMLRGDINPKGFKDGDTVYAAGTVGRLSMHVVGEGTSARPYSLDVYVHSTDGTQNMAATIGDVRAATVLDVQDGSGRTYAVVYPDESKAGRDLLDAGGIPKAAMGQLTLMVSTNHQLEADTGLKNAWTGIVNIGISEGKVSVGAVGTKGWECDISFDRAYLGRVADDWQDARMVGMHELAHGISTAATGGDDSAHTIQTDDYRAFPGLEEAVVQGYVESYTQNQLYGPDEKAFLTEDFRAPGSGSYMTWVTGTDSLVHSFADKAVSAQVTIGERLDFYRTLIQTPLGDRPDAVNAIAAKDGYVFILTGTGLGSKMGYEYNLSAKPFLDTVAIANANKARGSVHDLIFTPETPEQAQVVLAKVAAYLATDPADYLEVARDAECLVMFITAAGLSLAPAPARKFATARIKEWDESLHPRDDLGRFGEGGDEGVSSITDTTPLSIVPGDQWFTELSPGAQTLVQDTMKEYGVKTTDLKDEIMTRLGGPNTEAVRAAAEWYPTANMIAQAMSAESEGKFTQEQAAAVLAVLSPQCAWTTDEETAARMGEYWVNGGADRYEIDRVEMGEEVALMQMTADFRQEWKDEGWGGVGVDGSNRSNLALPENITLGFGMLLDTGRIDETLDSVKVRSFYENIMSPDGTDDVTVDVHMGKVTGFAESGLDKGTLGAFMQEGSAQKEKWRMDGTLSTEDTQVSSVGYVAIAEAVRQVASEWNLPASTVQAAYWVAVQHEEPPGWPAPRASWNIETPLADRLAGIWSP